jgi:hypothetical protein
VAVILKFPEVLREPAKSGPDFGRTSEQHKSAQILFFTGVRYERMEKAKRQKAKAEPELPMAL